MLTWGQQSANSIILPSVPHDTDDTVWGITPIYPCLEILHMPSMSKHAFCFVRHRSPAFHMLEGLERFINWVCSFLSLSLAAYSCPIYAQLPFCFPFSWTFPHLLNTCICHNLFWALVLINSCVSVEIMYYFFQLHCMLYLNLLLSSQLNCISS